VAEATTGEVALLFSGGLDSTAAAVRLSERFGRVHLLTCSRGYGHFFLGSARRRAEELRARLGDRFSFELLDIRPLFERVVLSTLREDYRRYGSAFVWCLGCKVCMHARSIAYCRDRAVGTASDGSSGDTQVFVEQRPATLELVRAFYRAHGVEFTTPVYDQSREEKRRLLRERGLRLGLRVGDRHIGVQPKCVPGELYYLPTVLFGLPPRHDDGAIAGYFAEKSELAASALGLSAAPRPGPGAR
jgi:predicted subunit of tRNA(5-methylaminomethyl-2-thiouridylate) methyltransferase